MFTRSRPSRDGTALHLQRSQRPNLSLPVKLRQGAEKSERQLGKKKIACHDFFQRAAQRFSVLRKEKEEKKKTEGQAGPSLENRVLRGS